MHLSVVVADADASRAGVAAAGRRRTAVVVIASAVADEGRSRDAARI